MNAQCIPTKPSYSQNNLFKGTMLRDFRLQVFFHETVSPRPLSSIPLWPFRGSRFTGVVDTGGKFATGVIDTGGAPLLANISSNFETKIRNDPNVIFRDRSKRKLVTTFL